VRRVFIGWVGATLSVGACVERSDVLSRAPSEASFTAGAAPFVEAVSANEMHTCALSAGVIYCWGDDTLGQLGVGSVAERLTPTPIEQTGWQSVHTGETHTCALSLRGDVYCWGGNARGQLGQGNTEPLSLPIRVALGARATAISTGFSHTCALLENAELWCWGDNNEGQLGRGDGNPGEGSRAADGLLPERVPAPTVSGEGIGSWALVDAGEGHTCALQVDNSLWCWGRNSQGHLGTPTEQGQQRSPILVSTEHAWTQLDAAVAYTCALDGDRSLWCWGHNQGTNSNAGNPFGAAIVDAFVPTRVGAGPWQAMSTHGFHTCGLDAAAALWCWGRTSDGQIPSPDAEVHVEPLQVADNVAQVSVGMFHTCFTTLDGTLQCAGQNDRWQLGEGGREEGIFLPVTLSPRSADAGP
jgi:alpha-tubulin suppressor-like RCC1 family protein